MLKRLLSAILTIAMIISFIPASFASAEDATAAAEVENVKIVYGVGHKSELNSTDYFTAVISPLTSKSYINDINDYETTNGFWKTGGYKQYNPSVSGAGNYNNIGNYVQTYIRLLLMDDHWRAFKFHVPVAGEYTVKLNSYVSNPTTAAPRIAFTVFPGNTSEAEITSVMDDVYWTPDETTTEDLYDGTFFAPEGLNIAQYNARHQGTSFTGGSIEYNFQTPGEYIFVIENIACDPANADSSNGRVFTMSNFTLTKGTNPTSVPMGITTITDEDASILVGGTTTATFGALYGSGDWAKYDTVAKNSTITYVSSDEEVATVDANGNVTGKGSGTAEISAVIDGAQLVSAPITVAAPRSDITVTYDFADQFPGWRGTTPFADFTYETSHNLWDFYDTTSSRADGSGTPLRYREKYVDMYYNIWFAVKINIPKTGEYTPKQFYAPVPTTSAGAKLDTYIIPVGDEELTKEQIGELLDNKSKYCIGSFDCQGTGNGWQDNPTYMELKPKYFDAGEYYLVYSGTYDKEWEGATPLVSFGNLVLDGGSGKVVTDFEVKSDISGEFLVGDTATASSTVYYSDATSEAASDVTYRSSVPGVATINSTNGAIEAVGAGTTTITATYGDYSDEFSITVEEPKISLAVANSVDETISVEAYKAGSVTVNAPTKTGHSFSHWVRGTADNGVWVSSDPSYTFDLVSPTYLTAIYVADGAKIVEFFNGNGELLAQKTVKEDETVDEPEQPKMVGFTFINWILGKNGNEPILFENKNISESLRVVADYEVESTKYTVGEDTDLVYDDEVVKNADSEDTVWSRDGKPVGYGKTYTYNVWANTTITSAPLTGEKTPLVYLDPVVKTVGDEKACMIEFDGAGMEIVEVGILFSTTGTPEVGSCQYKATSKTNGGDDGHGQFTAKPANSTQTVARGYLIYNENGEYKTVYSEVLSLS